MGNITHQVNTSNSVVAEFSFDACSVKLGFCECSETKTVVELIPMSEAGREGRRRNPVNWGYNLSGQPELFAGRGFTGHEDLPWFNLVNMNGRLYDPLVGRFLSVDPYIQDPGFTQEYNRYSYCLNNPLKHTDPSGYKKAPVKEDAFIMDYANYWNRRMLHGGGGGGGLNSFFRSSGVGRNTSSWLSNDYFVKAAYREGSYSSFVTSIETAMWNKGMAITGSGFHFQSVNPIDPKRIKRNPSSATNIDYFYIFVMNLECSFYKPPQEKSPHTLPGGFFIAFKTEKVAISDYLFCLCIPVMNVRTPFEREGA